jgi:hypothetical protein
MPKLDNSDLEKLADYRKIAAGTKKPSLNENFRQTSFYFG